MSLFGKFQKDAQEQAKAYEVKIQSMKESIGHFKKE